MVVRPSALQRGGDKKAPQAPWERICAQYGRCFASFVSSTASDRKGFVKGESVPLDPLLPPFGGAKGGPRRVGVLTKPCKRLRDADRRLQTIPHRAGVQVMPLQKAPPASLQRKFFLPPKKESSRLPPTAHFFTYYSIPVSCLVIRSQPM